MQPCEGQKRRARKGAEGAGLRKPVQVAERAGVAAGEMLGALVVGEHRLEAGARRAHGDKLACNRCVRRLLREARSPRRSGDAFGP